MVDLPLPEVPIVGYGEDEAAMQAFREQGTQRAQALGNRGPIRFDDTGKLDAAIVSSYTRHGFYIFENVIKADELRDIERGVAGILERAPVSKDAEVDHQGRPGLGVGHQARTFTWVKPLSDPRGGTDEAHGRYPTKMIEPVPPENSPEHVVQVLLGTMQYSEALLRLYGHPDLLAIAETINGEDFAPFSEGIFIKQPGLGGSVAWHQDGWTHWDRDDLDEHTHGFNFMVQLYGCNAANGLWVVPGSQRGKADIKAMAEAAGSDRLPQAVPLICAPGDIAITCRQVLHASFANTSPDVRVTLNLGFHRRSSLLGVKSGGVHNPVAVYDEEYIKTRSRLIGYGIDARRQRYPGERSFVYKPFAGKENEYRWTPQAKAGLKDYNLMDLGI